MKKKRIDVFQTKGSILLASQDNRFYSAYLFATKYGRLLWYFLDNEGTRIQPVSKHEAKHLYERMYKIMPREKAYYYFE